MLSAESTLHMHVSPRLIRTFSSRYFQKSSVLYIMYNVYSACIRYDPNRALLDFCYDVSFSITIIRMERADNGSAITLAGTGRDLKS